MIFIEPIGGMANRIRSMRAAFNLAQKYGHKIVVVWKLDKGLNARYGEIFKALSSFEVINIGADEENWVLSLVEKNNNFLKIEKDDVSKTWYLKFEEQYKDYLLNSQAVIYFTTCYEFYKEMPGASLVLYLQEELERKVREIVHDITSRCCRGIGIHIRRTDQVKSWKHSPTYCFVEIMKKELAYDKDTIFFLATDDENERKYLKEIFGDRLFYNTECIMARNSVQGIQSAAVDFYVLANMQKIYGSYYSSFSEEAAKINNVPLIIIDIQNKSMLKEYQLTAQTGDMLSEVRKKLDTKKRYSIFGGGVNGIECLRLLKQLEIDVVCIWDNSSSKWGAVVEGVKICNPEEIYETDTVIIVASFAHGEEIKAQLKHMGLKEEIDYLDYYEIYKICVRY